MHTPHFIGAYNAAIEAMHLVQSIGDGADVRVWALPAGNGGVN
ncbi:MAG: hypothetical protein Q8K24_09460 [Hydrogenophaga sp.]|nr:hypothetical protein [Hydrogenophaga sp.]